MVPNGVAAARQCPDAGELAMTRKHLIRDAKAESKPAETMAFGIAMPRELRFVPPRNRVRESWLRCESAMPDLETMDVVWQGITHLESVKAFVNWLREHPEVSHAIFGFATFFRREKRNLHLSLSLDVDIARRSFYLGLFSLFQTSPPVISAMLADPARHVPDDETLAHLESDVEQIAGNFKVDGAR